VRDRWYDAVVLDIAMPDIDGYARRHRIAEITRGVAWEGSRPGSLFFWRLGVGDRRGHRHRVPGAGPRRGDMVPGRGVLGLDASVKNQRGEPVCRAG